MKTTKLLYPEWQGYGENRRVYEGAYTLFEAFSGGIPFFEVDVPEDENLIVEGGILGRSAIVRSATIALDHLGRNMMFAQKGVLNLAKLPF